MGKKPWFFPHYLSCLNIKKICDNLSKNLSICWKTAKIKHDFPQIIENYISTSKIFFQDLLGNKPWFLPQPWNTGTAGFNGFSGAERNPEG
ncbi:hypothetical protein EBB54_14200 [Schaedlerella arabinosiphila]|uniref:Uncharacterized protein n=1 Tax=Schaedlerella arabinosiphila TaxID=2044587 RepID=A0A426DI05_9FIRM|nr:hypothetical protein EBB54_14200 [Schaedlerella arabinosiphila]